MLQNIFFFYVLLPHRQVASACVINFATELRLHLEMGSALESQN